MQLGFKIVLSRIWGWWGREELGQNGCESHKIYLQMPLSKSQIIQSKRSLTYVKNEWPNPSQNNKPIFDSMHPHSQGCPHMLAYAPTCPGMPPHPCMPPHSQDDLPERQSPQCPARGRISRRWWGWPPSLHRCEAMQCVMWKDALCGWACVLQSSIHTERDKDRIQERFRAVCDRGGVGLWHFVCMLVHLQRQSITIWTQFLHWAQLLTLMTLLCF